MKELLSPAGNMECLKAAIHNGADAIYLGGKSFGARAFAGNFTNEELKEAVNYAHLYGVKIYVTANTIIYNNEIKDFLEYIKYLYQIGVDALIMQDIGMISLVRKIFLDIEVHASTQCHNHNSEGIKLLKSLGVTRVVLDREMSLKEIENINIDIEKEVFIHGALCNSYSGCCLFSFMNGGRSGNRGECTQVCRLPFKLIKNGKYIDTPNKYLLSTKELNTISNFDKLLDSDIVSFKIEGRMKTALYVATVARTYRLAIDDFLKDPELYKSRIPFYKSEISKCTYRQYTTGFFFGKPDENTQIYESNTYIKEYTYLGIVGDMNEEGLYNIEQRNKFSVGEQIEVMKPDGENIQVTVRRITDDKGKDMESCPHPKQQLYIDLGVKLDRYDILRRKED